MAFDRFFNSACTTIKNSFSTTDGLVTTTQYDVKLNITLDHLLARDATTWATLGLSSLSTLIKVRDGLLVRIEHSKSQIKDGIKKLQSLGCDYSKSDLEEDALEGRLAGRYYHMSLSKTRWPRYRDTNLNEAQIKESITASEQVEEFSMMIKRCKETIELVEDVISIKPMSDQDMEELKHNPALDTDKGHIGLRVT